MKKKLFQVAVIFHEKIAKTNPTDPDQYDTQILVQPKWMLATDERTCSFKLVRELEDKYVDKLDQIDLLIAAF